MFQRLMIGLIVALLLSFAPAIVAQETPSQGNPAAEQSVQPEPQNTDKTEESKAPISYTVWLQQQMEPLIIPKDGIVRLGDGYAYPHRAARWEMIIIDEDDENVTLQNLPPEDPESILHKLWRQRQDEEIIAQLERQIIGTARTVDFYADIVPLPSIDSLHFEAVDSGLPRGGLWQVGFDIADMNEDGHDDLVVPPQRKGSGRPYIFLGSGDGTFSVWQNAAWSTSVTFDYGGVAVGDFDRDGHQDIVFALHLRNQYLCYGDGKGDFTRSERLPSRDPRLFSRAPDVGDFNGDGWPDIVFMAEIGIELSTGQLLPVKTTWILENLKGQGWNVQDDEFEPRMMSDRIVAADIDGDGLDDIVRSFSILGGRVPLLLNRTEGEDWDLRVVSPEKILSDTAHFEIAVLDPPKGVEEPGSLIGTFAQGLMVADLAGEKPAERQTRTGFVVYDLKATEEGFAIETHPVVISDGKMSYWRLGVGDLNGDGLPDMVGAGKNGVIDVYLRQADGTFVQERSAELSKQAMGTPYAVEVHDFDGDGLDDILVMGATSKTGRKGGLQLWKSKVQN
ncbi:MAG: VCBS repeat-containing protein [bacterium]|nr:VCBS repeat-containing protein [bacterium]